MIDLPIDVRSGHEETEHTLGEAVPDLCPQPGGFLYGVADELPRLFVGGELVEPATDLVAHDRQVAAIPL